MGARPSSLMNEFGSNQFESMQPTEASFHPRVQEANLIVGTLAFKELWKAKMLGDKEVVKIIDVFLRGKKDEK